ncbi:prolyl oligopeptidase family serine peptidase [uncultured Shewanella sp.]|uniref:alpha/beta hydrolase family protein n=1 Tax=uncultured Shewanella sp. TaxID=173975 RepID=UPI002607A944|nr:prolyl oligopeptidase family serine peptidase [uncultured Shewanella sp.]
MSIVLATSAFALSLSVLAPFNGDSSVLIENPNVIQQQDCFSGTFSSYNVWQKNIKQRYQPHYHTQEQISHAMSAFEARYPRHKFNDAQRELACSTFTYMVDGIPVDGFVIKPKFSIKPLPVVIFNRGGNGDFGRVGFKAMMHTLFPIAREGFVIIGSQYRGSYSAQALSQSGLKADGRVSVEDEFGGRDIEDVMALLDYIPSIAGADSKRIGLFGWSRGGMQSYLVLKQIENIKAVVTVAGDTDLLAGLSQRPDMERVYKKRIPDYSENKDAELEKRSVIKWVDKLPTNVPILLLHGSDDRRVDVSHSITFAEKLKQHNLSHKLVVYDKDDHGLTRNKEQAYQEVVTWFKQYL